MAELETLEPCAGLGLPLALGRCRLVALPQAQITEIQPFPGRMAAVNAVLQPLGLRFPAPGESLTRGGQRLCWAGRETAFLLGGAAPAGLSAHAAVRDQSDGWAGLRLEGGDCVDVLARLVPLDLRQASFASGRCVRAPLNHVPALFMRVSGQAFDILVFRSMVGTAVEELTGAMRGVAARRPLG